MSYIRRLVLQRVNKEEINDSIKELRTKHFSTFLLTVVYSVGIIGMLSAYRESFSLLTPLNLMFSAIVVAYNHPDWNWKVIAFILIAFTIGFFLEVVGVATGLIFGSYHYGPVLGPQWEETPFIIGLNWAMLVYCTGIGMNHVLAKAGYLVKTVLGALVLTSLDVLIEPVAINYNMWTWDYGVVPWQNYGAWFSISLFLLLLFYWLIGNIKNKVAFSLLVIQFLFFWILGIDW